GDASRPRSHSSAHLRQSARRASFLGCVFGTGVGLAATVSTGCPSWPVGIYACYLRGFHWSEYFITALANPPAALQLGTYLMDNSLAYWVAALVSWLEFCVEHAIAPDLKACPCTVALGAALCSAGEAIRKLAMLTAGANFNHTIEWRKRPEHELVRRGVYSLARHPAYLGWLLWACGTQLLLCNPVSLVAYAAASWAFFNRRIRDEERLLVAFFGREYVRYRRRVWSGVPFVRGYADADSACDGDADGMTDDESVRPVRFELANI
uniref:Protein-S-isoprenylcysteine O-methyltransferase n=1 Tax=Macrostomum lignano TaxID=282301 RepID=A0A1I8GBE2_9PLAT